jgi:excisionase family DNA binding protein
MDQSASGVDARYVTVSEVAAALRVSNMTVYRLINAGELPAVRIGRCVRVAAEDLDQYLSGRLIKAE